MAKDLAVYTDLSDYQPGETATITIEDLTLGGTVLIEIDHVEGAGADGKWGTLDDEVYQLGGEGHEPWYVTDGGAGDLDGRADGRITTTWFVNPDDSLNERFLLTAREVEAGRDGQFGYKGNSHVTDDILTDSVASTSFTDGGGDFSIDFAAAAPTSYNHLTGGGAFDDGTIGKAKDVVESLEGGDFMCNDIVTYFALVTVDADAVGAQTIDMNFQFLAHSTGKQGTAIGDIVNVQVNYGTIQDLIAGENTVDDGIIDDGGSIATLISESLTGPLFQKGSLLLGTVRLDDLEAGEQVVVRIDTRIFCDPGASPTGNMQASLASVSTVDGGGGEAVPGGAQTIPFKRVGDIGEASLELTKQVDTDADGDMVFTDTETVAVGISPITATYRYVLTNSGTAAAFDVVLTDDNATPGDPTDDFVVPLIGLTDVDMDGFADDLAIGATATADVTVAPFTAGPSQQVITNIATMEASSLPGGAKDLVLTADATITIPAVPPPAFEVFVDKVTYSNGMVALAGDDVTILAGSDVTWRYLISADMDLAAAEIDSVTDNQPGVTPLPVESGGFNIGDSNTDGVMQTTETWVYEASGTAIDGAYDNIGTFQATVTNLGGSVTRNNSDTSSYTGVTALIDIDKKTYSNGAVALAGDGVTILAGSDVTWRYTVTNTGDVALSDIGLIDDQIGAVTNLVSGDTNSNSILDLTETWIYEASGTAAAGAYSNTGTADGDFSDVFGNTANPDASDGSSYTGVTALIDIDKVTNGSDGPLLLAGTDVTWTYTVTNIGDVALSSISVIDDQIGAVTNLVSGDTNGNSILDLTETWIYEASGTAQSGSYVNTGTATGSFTDGFGNTATPTASNDSSYFGTEPPVVVTGNPQFNFPNDVNKIQPKLKGGSFTLNPTGTIYWDIFSSDFANAKINPASAGTGYGFDIEIVEIWNNGSQAVWRIYVTNETDTAISLANNTDIVTYNTILTATSDRSKLDLVNADPIIGNFNSFNNIENALQKPTNSFDDATDGVLAPSAGSNKIWASIDRNGTLDDETPTLNPINALAGDDLVYGVNQEDDPADPDYVVETLNGGDDADLIDGRGGDDLLNGENGADVLYGGLGNDTLNGGAGNDTLIGSYGIDEKTGGSGADLFVLEPTAFDTLTDFLSGTDQILFGDFSTSHGARALAAGEFDAGLDIGAGLAGAHFFYDTDDDRLFYDRDGLGTGDGPMLIANVTGVSDVAATDILVDDNLIV